MRVDQGINHVIVVRHREPQQLPRELARQVRGEIDEALLEPGLNPRKPRHLVPVRTDPDDRKVRRPQELRHDRGLKLHLLDRHDPGAMPCGKAGDKREDVEIGRAHV